MWRHSNLSFSSSIDLSIHSDIRQIDSYQNSIWYWTPINNDLPYNVRDCVGTRDCEYDFTSRLTGKDDFTGNFEFRRERRVIVTLESIPNTLHSKIKL